MTNSKRLLTELPHETWERGYDAGAKAERTRMLKMMEEMCDEDVADAVTFG